MEGVAIPVSPTPPNTAGSPDFSLEELADCFSINGVQYRDGMHKVDLAKTLLNEATQDVHIAQAIQAQQSSQFYAPDAPLSYSIPKTLFKNKDNSQYREAIERARAFLQEMFEKRYLMTLTRIQYKKEGKDTVIHNPSMPDQDTFQENIVGQDGYIARASNKAKPLKAIFRTDDSVHEINSVFKWISGKDTYICRLNSKPSQDTERIVRLSADPDGFGVDCYGVSLISRPASGVRFTRLRVAPQNIGKK